MIENNGIYQGFDVCEHVKFYVSQSALINTSMKRSLRVANVPIARTKLWEKFLSSACRDGVSIFSEKHPVI